MSKFHQLLEEQIQHEYFASQQYVAIATYYDVQNLPQLSKLYFAHAQEERGHARRIAKYLKAREVPFEIPGIPPVQNEFKNPLEPIELSIKQEKAVTEQIVTLAAAARDEHDFLGEQFMDYYLDEQVEEEDYFQTLLAVARRENGSLFDLEDHVHTYLLDG